MERKLLIVEDNAHTRSRIREVAESIGSIRVIAEAADAQSAIRAITVHDPDLLTLDIRLAGGESGLTVLDFLRNRSRPPQVIVLSSALDPQQTGLHLLAGASHALDKMMDFDRLAEVLNKPCGPSPEPGVA